jgi:hypothetical protein
MSPENPEVGSAADWLRRAKSDLALAGVALPRFRADRLWLVGGGAVAGLARYFLV